jgi:ATP-dependent Clp protease protease subunit
VSFDILTRVRGRLLLAQGTLAVARLAAGAKWRRPALPNARVMIHLPAAGARGMVSDIEIQAKESKHARTR